MELLAVGIRAKCDVSDSLYRWPGIRAIVSTKDHVFVMLGSSMGYPIPRERVTGGDLDGFVQTARSRLGLRAPG